jgi:hypothetical protein
MPPLIQIHRHKRLVAELARIADSLERLAFVAETKFLHRVQVVDSKEEGEVLFQTDEDYWRLEQLEERHRKAMGDVSVDLDLEDQEK